MLSLCFGQSPYQRLAGRHLAVGAKLGGTSCSLGTNGRAGRSLLVALTPPSTTGGWRGLPSFDRICICSSSHLARSQRLPCRYCCCCCCQGTRSRPAASCPACAACLLCRWGAHTALQQQKVMQRGTRRAFRAVIKVAMAGVDESNKDEARAATNRHRHVAAGGEEGDGALH